MTYSYIRVSSDRQTTENQRFEISRYLAEKVLAFAFGLSAEIERNLISQRTKEALARKKAEGVRLGRPRGNDIEKLLGREAEIRQLISQRHSKAHIMRRFGVSRQTLHKFMNQSGITEKIKPSTALDSIA